MKRNILIAAWIALALVSALACGKTQPPKSPDSPIGSTSVPDDAPANTPEPAKAP